MQKHNKIAAILEDRTFLLLSTFIQIPMAMSLNPYGKYSAFIGLRQWFNFHFLRQIFCVFFLYLR